MTPPPPTATAVAGPATRTQTRTRTPHAPAAPAAAAGPGPVSFGYRVEVRTGGAWTEVRTDHTPPIFRLDPITLDAIADTILGNAGPVLGLGPYDPLPPVRVQTWHEGSGLTGSASRPA